jgi:hypothetical protein
LRIGVVVDAHGDRVHPERADISDARRCESEFAKTHGRLVCIGPDASPTFAGMTL